MNSIKHWIAILLLALSPLLLTPSLHAAERATLESSFSDAELAQMLAPIALYPDSLLTHILIASTYPLEVVQANRWRNKHKALTANQAVSKAEDKDWDPSVVALVAFPTVLEKLSEELDWTQKLGDAFLQDEAQVLSSIQTLRRQADEADSFNDMDNMRVIKVKREIIIEPAQKEIIYVPVYDTRVVYGHWRWYQYPPVYWVYPPRYGVRYPNHFSSHFYWHSGIHISFNYYFSAFRWHDRHIVVTHHHHSNYYRPRARIVSSSGAQRWSHKPQHRRGVAYSSTVVKQRYTGRHPSKMQVKQLSHAEGYRNASKATHNTRIQIPQKRQQDIKQKLTIQGKDKTHYRPSTNNRYSERQAGHSNDKQHGKRLNQPAVMHNKTEIRKTQPHYLQKKSHQPDRNRQLEKHHQGEKRRQPSQERPRHNSQGRIK